VRDSFTGDRFNRIVNWLLTRDWCGGPTLVASNVMGVFAWRMFAYCRHIVAGITTRKGRVLGASFSLSTIGVIQMKDILALVWLVIFVALPVRVIWTYGGQWEFGPHGIPVIALSPDGTTYRDGNELDPITAAITRSGNEETIVGCWLGGMSVLLAGLACRARREKHVCNIRAKRRESEALLALAKRYEQEGRQEEAKRAFASYWQSVEEEMALWLSRRSTRRMIEQA
jgi:hypothetical protein